MWPQPDSIAIYIHWPFCAKKCPYCDFAVTVRQNMDDAEVADALVRDLVQAASHYCHPPKAHSIYFGGGTPSLMSPSTAQRLVQTVSNLFGLQKDCEITLEANPTDAETAKLQGFRDAGINRLSLGLQSLDDTELMVLGRNHDGNAARRALDQTAKIFDNFSVDVMYALPRQMTDSWGQRLDELLGWNPTHVSLYQLTIEQGTVFEKAVDRGLLVPFEDDPAADLYELTARHLTAAGYPAYEVSNHAKPGFESRHNLSYWRYEDYVGAGTGAHGRITINGQKHATTHPRGYTDWIGGKDYESTPLPAQDTDEEAFLMSMRTCEGAIIGEHLTINQAKLEFLIQQDMIERFGNGFRPTHQGWLRLDTITGMLLT